MKTYVCRKIKLYGFLSKQGFTPYRIVKDKYNPKRDIWLYEWTESLDYAINYYYTKRPV